MLSIVIERPFCRYVCPLGAILTISSRIAPFRVQADENACKGCKLCTKNVCPTNAITMQVNGSNQPIVNNPECIRCLRCLEQCRFKALYIGPKKQPVIKKAENVIGQ